MTIELKLKARGNIGQSTEVAADMVEKYFESLSNNAQRMFERLMERIPDEDAFNKTIAAPATIGFSEMLKPSFMSRKERTASQIADTHGRNLGNKYAKWFQKLTKAFETVGGVVAARFKEAIAMAKDFWATAVTELTLRFTGDKVRGRGAVPIITNLLVGDRRAIGWLRSSDSFSGELYNIAPAGQRNALRTALNQRLMQAGQAIVASNFRTDEVDHQNNLTADLLTRLRDTAKADAFQKDILPDKCYCSYYVGEGGLFFLETQVVLTIP